MPEDPSVAEEVKEEVVVAEEGSEPESKEVRDCKSCSGARIEIAKDKEEYYWMLYSKNGRPIATNALPYKRLNDLKEAIESVRDNIDKADLVRLY